MRIWLFSDFSTDGVTLVSGLSNWNHFWHKFCTKRQLLKLSFEFQAEIFSLHPKVQPPIQAVDLVPFLSFYDVLQSYHDKKVVWYEH